MNQTCPFHSRLGQSSCHSSFVDIAIRYVPNVRVRVMWSVIMLNLLFILSAFTQIRLCPIPRFFGSSHGRRYAAIIAANSTADPSVGRSKNISSIFVGIVFIAPVIIIHAALYRRSSSDLAKAISILSHHSTAAYVILGITTRLYSHSAILGESIQILPVSALHDHRAFSPFSRVPSRVLFTLIYHPR